MSGVRRDGAVLCVGRVYADLIFSGLATLPEAGREVFAEGLNICAGGGAAITACYLADLGHNAELVATLPGAPFQTLMRDQIASLGVSLSGANEAAEGSAPQLTVVAPINGDRAFLTHRAGEAFDKRSLERRAKAARHIHVGEIRTLVDAPYIVDIAKKNGCSLSADCGWDSNIKPADIGAVLAALDVFLPNEAEADWLSSLGVSEEATALTVVKCGAKGARAGDLAIPAGGVTVRDATGAGDAFNAGFLSAWLAGEDLAHCLDAGNRQGARAIGYVGGIGALIAASSHRKNTPPTAELVQNNRHTA